MSLNLHLADHGMVLRVHQPFEGRRRIEGLRELRRRLSRAGLLVGEPLPLAGRDLVRWEGRWVELERHVPHVKPPATWDSYLWMYDAMGRLHRALREVEPLHLVRPTLATYGPPGTVRRWLAVTAEATAHDAGAYQLVERCRVLIRRLSNQWPRRGSVPEQLVHGDIRLGNVATTPESDVAYLDFGFAALRPRLHELGYSLSWMILRPDDSGTAEAFSWDRLSELIDTYEVASGERLSSLERASIGPYVAAVPLYLAALSGYTADPVAHVKDNEPFIDIAEWVLAHPPLT